MAFVENLKKLKSIDNLECIELYDAKGFVAKIPNEEGKKGSLQVYANILGFGDGPISLEAAREGLRLFDEYVPDAMNNRGKHPNIDYLFGVVKREHSLTAVIKYKNTEEK